MENGKAKEAFLAYANEYDISNPMIELKVTHTFKVAEIAEEIAKSLLLNDDDVDFAWMLGLLHDIGRFEQVRRYNTFFDAHSVDHAELGADILFKDGLIDGFVESGLKKENLSITETAIRQHNKLLLPEDLDDRTIMFCKILRDADKVDIFRVIYENPFEKRVGSSLGAFVENEEACPEVMNCVYEHRCIPREFIHTRFESRISQGCMAFELEFDRTRSLVEEQGYLNKLLVETDENDSLIWNGKETVQLRILKEELKKQWAK